MNGSPQRFPYLPRDPELGDARFAPYLPLTLIAKRRVETAGLVDSGAAINVMPYSLGLELGLEWEQHSDMVDLSGNLASVEARVALVTAEVGTFTPVRLALAWAITDEVSVILGQVNFFMQFDVCFFRSQAVFDVRAKAT